MKYAIVEKDNHNALHSIHESKAGAEFSLQSQIPKNCQRQVYDDKSLTPDDFIVVPYQPKSRR